MKNSLTCGVQKGGWVVWVVLAVSDHLVELLNALGLHVQHVIHCPVIFDVPQIYPQVVSWNKILSVWRETQRVNVVFVTVLVKKATPRVEGFVDHLGAGENEFALLQQLLTRFVLLFLPVFYLPKFYQLVIGWQQLGGRGREFVDPFYHVHLLGDLLGVQRVERSLVGLEFSQIVVVYVPIFNDFLEHNNSATPVSNAQILPLLIKTYRLQQILLCYVGWVRFS